MTKLLKRGEIGSGILIETDAGYISAELNKDILSEGIKLEPNKPIYINCVLQKANTKNKNDRYYPKEILVREDEKYQELIRSGSAVSESDHPESSVISLSNIAHMIVKTWWDGDILHGKLKLIVTKGYLDMGICSVIGDKILLYLQNGIRIGISSRGIGSLKTVNGKNLVQSDYELICYDLVTSPSTPGAYLYFSDDDNLKENIKSKDILSDNNKSEENNNQNLINGLNNFLKK